MSWPRAALGEVARVVGGATPRTGVPEYWGGDVHWATPKDLSSLETMTISATERRITGAGLRSCAAEVLPAGSVLLSSRAPIGYVAINSIPMATNQGFKSLIPDQRVLIPRFLAHWLRAHQTYLESLGTGATFKEISKAVVSRIAIPLPPLEEQRRIAEILDRADFLWHSHDAQVALARALPGRALFGALGGAARYSVTERSPARVNGWTWELLTDVAVLATGHTPDRTRPDYWNGDVSWLSLPEIRAHDGRVVDRLATRISQAGLANSSAVLLPAGTVCMSRTASVGFVTVLGQPMATSQDFHNWIPGPSILPGYLMEALRASRAEILRLCVGSVHKTLYQRIAQRLRVLLPPLSVQREIADVAQRSQALQVVLDRRADRLRRLREGVQQRAFNGGL